MNAEEFRTQLDGLEQSYGLNRKDMLFFHLGIEILDRLEHPTTTISSWPAIYSETSPSSETVWASADITKTTQNGDKAIVKRKRGRPRKVKA